MSKSTITIAGNVGRDPEVKTIPSGQSLVTFSVGVSDGFGDKKTTIWYSVSGWGDKLVETLPKYVKKGALVLVTGAFKVREYADKTSGQNKYSLDITAFSVERLDTRTEGGESAPTNRAAAKPVARTAPAPVARASTPIEDGTFISDDDLPF